MTIERLCQSLLNELKGHNFFSEVLGYKSLKFRQKLPFQKIFDERTLEAFIRFLPEHLYDKEAFSLVFHGVAVDLNSIKKSKTLDYDQLLRLHAGGATIVANGLDNFDNSLFYWSKFAEKLFECRAQVNFYGTPMNSRGFNPHSDDHDVIISQIKGTKDWSFYQLKTGFPTVSRKAYTSDEVLLNFEEKLNIDDSIYIPRGHLHSAKSLEQASWHLTTGLTGYYWSDCIKDGIEAIILQNPDLQQFVKIHSEGNEEIQKTALDILQEISEKISIKLGLSAFKKRFPNTGEHLESIALPDPDITDNIHLDSPFQLNTVPKPEISYLKHYISLHLPYRRKPLLLHLRLTKVIRHIENEPSFSPGQLIHLLAPDEALLLCYYLYKNGMTRPIS